MWWIWPFSFCLSAPVRWLHRLCVLGQRLHGNPCRLRSHRRVSAELLLCWRHHTFAPVSWRGHHKWPRRSSQIQVTFVHMLLYGNKQELSDNTASVCNSSAPWDGFGLLPIPSDLMQPATNYHPSFMAHWDRWITLAVESPPLISL